MDQNSSKISPRQFHVLQGIASGLRWREAAAQNAMSHSGVVRLMRRPEAQAELARLREEASQALAKRLPDLVRVACDRLHEALVSRDQRIQLQAATIVMRLAGGVLLKPEPDTTQAITIEQPPVSGG